MRDGAKVDRGGHDERGRLDGHELCACALIENGAVVDKQALQEWTALMFAAQGGHEQVARALLEKGDDKEAVQNQGLTALMFSCQNGHEQCARALMCSVFLCSGS